MATVPSDTGRQINTDTFEEVFKCSMWKGWRKIKSALTNPIYLDWQCKGEAGGFEEVFKYTMWKGGMTNPIYLNCQGKGEAGGGEAEKEEENMECQQGGKLLKHCSFEETHDAKSENMLRQFKRTWSASKVGSSLKFDKIVSI